MKKILVVLFVFLTAFGYAQKKESLFNGKNLKGWTIFVNDPKVTPEKYFYVKDGVIETVGVPMGYLRTKKVYSNYHLHVEWCYPEKPTNSGIFVHTNGPDQLWPLHYQCQLKNLNAGDFIVNAAGERATVGDSIYIIIPSEYDKVFNVSNNIYEIIVKDIGNTLIYKKIGEIDDTKEK